MSTSRETILSAVKRNKPEFSPLPELKDYPRQDISNLDLFKEMLRKMGGDFREIAAVSEAGKVAAALYPNARVIVSDLDDVPGNVVLSSVTDPHQLENVDLAIIEGHFGVAENAAVWVTDERLVHRAVPFICQHLILIIPKKDIVLNMHQAYKKMNVRANTYGVFIAGPSKTADIEQSLVIGAHGPRSMFVFLVGE